MRRLALLALVAVGCGTFQRTQMPKTPPKFGASLIFPGGGSTSGGGGGAVTQSTTPWVTAIRDQGTLATVDYGDTTNKAARVNIVAGASSGAVAQGSTTSGQTGGLSQGAATTAAPSYTTATTNPLSLTTVGALRVDGSAVTQPVSGTVTANASGTKTNNNAAPAADNVGALTALANAADPSWTEGRLVLKSVDLAGYMRALVKGTVAVSGTVAVTQSGTWTVQPGNTANTTPWLITGSELHNTSAPTTDAVETIGAIANAADPTFTEGKVVLNSVDLTGYQRSLVKGTVTANAGTNLNTSALALDATLTGGTQTTRVTDGTNTATVKAASTAAAATDKALVVAISPNNTVPVSLAANQSVNVAQINGVTPLMGNGTTGTGSQRVTIASDNTAFSVNSVESGTWTVQPGNTANSTPWLVQGNRGNGTAVPGVDNVGSIGVLWETTAGTYVNGRQGLMSGNAATGSIRLSGGLAHNILATSQEPLLTGAYASAAAPTDVTADGNAVRTWALRSGALVEQLSFGGVLASTGNGVSGTGVQRVAIASDNTAFSVNAAESGTWTVQPGNTANTTPWLVTGSKLHNSTAPTADALESIGALANAADPTFTEGNVVLNSVDLTGYQRSLVKGTVTAKIVGNTGAIFDAAHGATAPANVVMAGGVGIAQGSQPTATTAGQATRTLTSLEGVQYVQEGGSNRFSCLIQAATVTTQCQAAPGAGLRAYVTSFVASNQAATVQTLDIVFGTGTACATGTTAMTHKFQFGTNATSTSPFQVNQQFPTPLVPTAANAICVRPSAATAFGVTVTGFIAP